MRANTRCKHQSVVIIFRKPGRSLYQFYTQTVAASAAPPRAPANQPRTANTGKQKELTPMPRRACMPQSSRDAAGAGPATPRQRSRPCYYTTLLYSAAVHTEAIRRRVGAALHHSQRIASQHPRVRLSRPARRCHLPSCACVARSCLQRHLNERAPRTQRAAAVGRLQLLG